MKESKVCTECEKRFYRAQGQSQASWSVKFLCGRLCSNRAFRKRKAEAKKKAEGCKDVLNFWLYKYRPVDAVCGEAV